MPAPDLTVTVLCGGVGAARFLNGLRQVLPEAAITAVVNVGDDVVLHGLRVSPDIDTIVYTLADAVSAARGWGLEGETWQAMEMLARYGGPDWFSLGDADLGTHLYRTGRLAAGASLSDVTAEITNAWGLGLTIIPATDDRVETRVTTVDEGEIGFQEYFVGRQHDVAVTAVRFAGAETASPSVGVIEAISTSDAVVIAPSNPVVSVDPVLSIPGIRAAVSNRRSSTVAISPIIGGKALKGPADRLLTELGVESSAYGVAQWYQDVIGGLVIDNTDGNTRELIESLDMAVAVTDTIMASPEIAAQLARTALDLATGQP